MKCYSRFCDKQRIQRSEKRSLKRAATTSISETQSPPSNIPSTPSPKKRLRSHRPLSSTASSSSSGILPAVCIICKKTESYIKIFGKRTKDRLFQTQTLDGGLLREAATKKEDESILKHIRDKDCVAIEVRYHEYCYKKYVKFLSTMSADVDKEESDLYKQTFEAFSRDVVRTRIINGKEIIYMSKLLTIFKKMVLQIENLDATNFRSIQLKRRLQNKFPQLVFHRPAKQVKSDMVFVQSSTSDTTETESTESTSSDSSAGVRKPQDFDQDSLHCLYTSAMKLRAEFVECIGYEGPWPPLDCDLTIAKAKSMIPIKLYNILAWTIGASDEPTLDSYVEIEESVELKLLSILQDIISLQSKGRKHTPKSLALGLTIRHLTGSQKVINLLHGLGHCASHKTIIRYDTSLAQLQSSKGPVYIPTGFQSDVNTLLVWDNIDFSEETISGHGTTHHTNGIAIQCTTPCVEEVTDTQRIPLPKVPSTELHTATTITAYHPKRRTGPPVGTINKELIQKNNYSKFHLRQHKIDLAFLLIKHFNSSDNLYPGWTGFNTELASTDDLQKSKIAYLPVIEASPTEMNTVNTILCRSIEFADKLNLRSITVVFDLTIYAKAQEIRWTDENFLKRLVIRLGEFHTSMSFLSVIGKRFRDAGLHDILIEAEIVAGGSINGVLDGKHYNRCMNAHKLVLEALTRLKLKAFFESLTEEIRAKLIRFMEYMADSYQSQLFKDLCASDEFSEIITLITDYDQKKYSIKLDICTLDLVS